MYREPFPSASGLHPHSSQHGSVGNRQTTLTQNQGCCGFESHLSYFRLEARGLGLEEEHERELIPPALCLQSETTTRVGLHWRATLAVNQPSSDSGGSTPSRPTW